MDNAQQTDLGENREATPEAVLARYWGYDHFRFPQKEVIDALLSGRDVLALMPTGAGKSLCFQVSALCMSGVCVVVSPLVALMQDHVEDLEKRHIPALAFHAGMRDAEIDLAMNHCQHQKVKLLYLTPERLRSRAFVAALAGLSLSLFVVDEAHAISQWGHDFRPSYRMLSALRPQLPPLPWLALTASATPAVQHDILSTLALRDPQVLRQSVRRKNLSLSVLFEEKKQDKLLDILSKVSGPALVYVQRRKAAEALSQWLLRKRVRTSFYHAGQTHVARSLAQKAWMTGKVRVMVATRAFGMGIHKPDVRVLVHMGLPEDLSTYYQESGRAGRDDTRSYALILCHDADIEDATHRLTLRTPELATLETVYQALGNHFKIAVGTGNMSTHPFSPERFSTTIGASQFLYALRRLEECGLLQLSDAFYRSARLRACVDKQGWYAFSLQHTAVRPLMDHLLRSYGGELFSRYCPIDEASMARRLRSSLMRVSKHLAYMAQCELIDYVPATDAPMLTFLRDRAPQGALQSHKTKLAERKKQLQDELTALTAYLRNAHTCRMQQLMHYFGEPQAQDYTCGICDACLAKRRQQKAQE